jgi:hypothetical protein
MSLGKPTMKPKRKKERKPKVYREQYMRNE